MRQVVNSMNLRPRSRQESHLDWHRRRKHGALAKNDNPHSAICSGGPCQKTSKAVSFTKRLKIRTGTSSSNDVMS